MKGLTTSPAALHQSTNERPQECPLVLGATLDQREAQRRNSTHKGTQGTASRWRYRTQTSIICMENTRMNDATCSASTKASPPAALKVLLLSHSFFVLMISCHTSYSLRLRN